MRDDRFYRRERGFSARVMSLILDDFTRHGADIASLSLTLRGTARTLARNEEDVRELALLCAAMQQLSDRIVSDAFKARIEMSRLVPVDTPTNLSVCICGKTIEDRSCRTGGHCSRGIDTNITA